MTLKMMDTHANGTKQNIYHFMVAQVKWLEQCIEQLMKLAKSNACRTQHAMLLISTLTLRNVMDWDKIGV